MAAMFLVSIDLQSGFMRRYKKMPGNRIVEIELAVLTPWKELAPLDRVVQPDVVELFRKDGLR